MYNEISCGPNAFGYSLDTKGKPGVRNGLQVVAERLLGPITNYILGCILNI